MNKLHKRVTSRRYFGDIVAPEIDLRQQTPHAAKNTVKIMSVHEHNLVPTIINEMRYFRYITCSTIYCRLCGKSLEASATQNH
jgi:hypothetical protein